MMRPDQPRQRHGRLQFFVFGVLPVLNVLALLLRGLVLSTGGSSNTERALVVILVAALVSLACAGSSAIKRGRDLGFTAAKTVGLIALSFVFLPLLVVLMAYFSLAKAPAPAPDERPAGTMGIGWLWAPVLLLAPWMALLFAAALR